MAVVDMQEKLGELRRQWAKEGKPELFMRVGINTGIMVVGNMGTKNRMSYGMNGDSVNLAARLEGANKAYNTFSMISEFTYRQAKDFIEVRELDSIRVVGKEQPVKVYELLGKTGSIDDGLKDILPWYQEGLRYYKEKRWEGAIGCFEKALVRRPQDGPSSTMMKRCILFKENPPAKDWDGIFSLESK